MSSTGIISLDHSIDTTNAWIADVAKSFGTRDRRMAYRVTRSWLHTLRDRLPVPVAAHLAAQLPDLLRGVFYDGWNPSKVPIKYGKDEYAARFASNAQIHLTEAGRSGRLVTAALRRHLSKGVIDEALAALPADVRHLVEPAPPAEPARAAEPAGSAPAKSAPAPAKSEPADSARSARPAEPTEQTGGGR